MTIAADEICHRFGEAKFKEMFGAVNANTMKAALHEAGIATIRQASHTSTRKRNEDWANKLWQRTGPLAIKGCTIVLYQWFMLARRDLLTSYLDAVGVEHQNGLTEADFLNEVPPVLLQEEARKLLDDPRFERREVAAYFLFLDSTAKTDRFEGLGLTEILTPAG